MGYPFGGGFFFGGTGEFGESGKLSIWRVVSYCWAEEGTDP